MLHSFTFGNFQLEHPVFQDSYKNELLEEIKEMTEELKRRSTMISNLEEQLEKVKVSFFSKVKLSSVILTIFEFSHQKVDTKSLKNGTFKSIPTQK